ERTRAQEGEPRSGVARELGETFRREAVLVDTNTFRRLRAKRLDGPRHSPPRDVKSGARRAPDLRYFDDAPCPGRWRRLDCVHQRANHLRDRYESEPARGFARRRQDLSD